MDRAWIIRFGNIGAKKKKYNSLTSLRIDYCGALRLSRETQSSILDTVQQE